MKKRLWAWQPVGVRGVTKKLAVKCWPMSLMFSLIFLCSSTHDINWAHMRGVLSGVWLRATPRTVARQAPLSLGFSRQEHWRGLWCSPPEDLPDPGIAPPVFYVSFWQAGSLPLHHLGSPFPAQKYILNKPDLWNARLWSRYIRERFFWWGAFSHYERILKRLTVFPPQIEIDFLDCYGL